MASEANEGTKRMWHVEGTSLRMHESGFYTTVAMFGSQEMADDFGEWLQHAEAAERRAENLQDAVAEMIYHAREHGDTEFVSAVMDALNDEIGVIRDRLQAEIDDNRQRAETAEQRAANIETRTAVKLGEFAKLVDIIDAECKRLGIQWHGSVSTTLKAIIDNARPAPPPHVETGGQEDGPGTKLRELFESVAKYGYPPAGFVQMKEAKYAEFVAAVNDLRDAVYEPGEWRPTYAAKVIRAATKKLAQLKQQAEAWEKEARLSATPPPARGESIIHK